MDTFCESTERKETHVFVRVLPVCEGVGGEPNFRLGDGCSVRPHQVPSYQLDHVVRFVQLLKDALQHKHSVIPLFLVELSKSPPQKLN